MIIRDEYDDHLFIDGGPPMHLCIWGRGTDSECGDAADSQNHRNDPNVITTPLEEILEDQSYIVSWSIELDAESAVDAARQAQGILQDPHNEAWHFQVWDEPGYRHDVHLEIDGQVIAVQKEGEEKVVNKSAQ